jgi:hypothetical protein
MLLSMFDTIKKVGGTRQEQKAREALDDLLNSMKKNANIQQEPKAIDAIQKIKIERSGIL